MRILQTYGNLDYELTDEQVEKVQEKSKLGKNGGIWIGKDYIAFASIKSITELPDKKQAVLNLPAKGYEGIVKSAKKGSHLEALARGLKKAIEKRKKAGLESPGAEILLGFARQRYALLKADNRNKA